MKLSFRLIKTNLSCCDQHVAGNNCGLQQRCMVSKLLVQLLAVGGLVNESEYRLLQYCNTELLFLMYFTKCDASTKHDAIV